MSANKFVARNTKPTAGNKYYIRKANGGYSDAIAGSPTDKDCNVLSNCVGYAYGRFNEIGGWGSCKYLAPVNAELFMQYKGSCQTGQVPKIGACMVWQKGATLSGSDGAGHVAIVEKVISATEVVTSESAWGGSAFYTKTRKKGTDGKWGYSGKFLGFIYNPAECCKDQPKEDPKDEIEVGDIVEITGGYSYISSTAKTAANVNTKGKAKVTKTAKGKAHPYHCVGEKGGSNIWGWTDAANVKPLTTVAKPAKKSNEEIAREVINGKWGNGEERKKRLTAAGYDYATVQGIVNKLCK